MRETSSIHIGATRALIVMAPSSASPSLLFDVGNGARRNLGMIGNRETIRAIAISLNRRRKEDADFADFAD